MRPSMELALADFWTAQPPFGHGDAVLARHQQDDEISMCALYGRMTGAGMLTACETDILGALSMLVNYQAALGQTLPHFVDWTIQHRENPNRLLAWHCGNAPVAWPADPRKWPCARATT